MIDISPTLQLTDESVEFRYKRAAGPGGQHVNKTDTAVELRFDVNAAGVLPDVVRDRLLGLARRRISRQGLLIIHASRFRSQERNREDALARLADMLRAAEAEPIPRIKTRPTRASRERRLTGKKMRGERKRARGRLRQPEDS